VTIAHSKTRDLPAVCRRGALIFAAVGKPEMVRRDWVKPDATIIDVGINRVSAENGKTKIVGDVAFAEVFERPKVGSRSILNQLQIQKSTQNHQAKTVR